MPTSITLVSEKGAPLTVSEFDTNLSNLKATADAAAAASVPANILSELLAIDGTGTGLDADKLDGAERTEFIEHALATEENSVLMGVADPFGSFEEVSLSTLISDIESAGIDSDTVDGQHASEFEPVGTLHDDRYYTEDEVDALLAIVEHAPESCAETGDGTLDSGDYTDLAEHGSGLVSVSEGSGGTGFTLDLGWTSIPYFDNVVIYAQYDGGVTHDVLVQLYNYTAVAYENIGIIPHNASDFSWFAFPVVNPEHYIEAGTGNVALRFQHDDAGNPAHDFYLDMCVLRKGGVAGGGVTEHGSLTGLSDDDHPQYILHSLATAEDDFLVASGSGVFEKQTLAEVQATLGLDTAAYEAASAFAPASEGVTNGDSHDHAGGDGAQIDHGGLAGLGDDDHTQDIKHSLATLENDFLVASGSGTFVKKTLAETGAILESDIDHGSIQGLGDDDHTQYIKHALATAANDFLVASGSGTFVKKTLSETLAILDLDTVGISVAIDGEGSAIATGIYTDVEVPFDCTITTATMLADQSGSVAISLWKDTYANFPPTVADVIDTFSISTATKSQETGLSIACTAGDIIRLNVDSCTTITRLALALRMTRG